MGSDQGGVAVIFNGAGREALTNMVSMPEQGEGAATWPSGQGEQPVPSALDGWAWRVLAAQGGWCGWREGGSGRLVG